jgi:hypothetical protein
MDQDRNATVESLNQLNKARQIAVVIALGLLVVSLVAPSTPLAVARSLAWAAAGVLSLLHATKAKEAGLVPNYLNAVIYFVVAVLPLVRGR